MAIDILIKIEFHLNEGKRSVIKTNAVDRAAVEEILEEFLLSQMGKGEDQSRAEEKDIYEISIGLDMSGGDVFYTKSDTGNKGLTAGIVDWILQNLDDIRIAELDG
ncbi:MAG: hypothetical protein WC461_00740 [Candidatus Paceibacterota bacterium]